MNTLMQPLDFGLLAVIGFVCFLGWRSGGVGTAASIIGIGTGVWTALLLAPALARWLTSVEMNTELASVLAAGGLAAILSVLGDVLASLAISRLSAVLAVGRRRRFDRGAGVAIALLVTVLVIWVGGAAVQRIGSPTAAIAVTKSTVVGTIDDVIHAPVTPALNLLDSAGLSGVLPNGLEGPNEVGKPDAHIPQAVQDVSGSVVKVLAQEPGCGSGSEGSGWVDKPGYVITNAHVVAASTSVVVQTTAGANYPAEVVYFNPDVDVAALAVPGLTAAPIPVGSQLSSNDDAVAAGYPNDGGFKQTPARVREQIESQAFDIYGTQTVTRQVYALRSEIEHGNSGGPLLDDEGEVVGVVYAKSTSNPETGYAITIAQVSSALKAANHGAVPTGECLAAESEAGAVG